MSITEHNRQTSDDVVIRLATHFDIEVLLDLKRRASGALLFRLGHSIEDIKAWQDTYCTVGHLQRIVDEGFLFLLEDGGTPKGMASLHSGKDDGVSYGYFGNLYTSEKASGFGSRLMQHRLGAVDACRYKYSESHVHSMNMRARRFVEHYGFQRHGTYTEETHGGTIIVYRRVTP